MNDSTPIVGHVAVFKGMTKDWAGKIERVGQNQFGIHQAQMVTNDGSMIIIGDIGHWQDTLEHGWVIHWQDATTLRTYQ